ncbi:unnamed protein product, partial [Didymodactylos carnosus]
MRLPGEPQGM